MISWIFSGQPQILGFPPEIQDALAAPAHITVSDAADGATQTVAPGSALVEAGRFGMVIDRSSGTCTIAAFTFPANIVAGIAAVELWNAAGTTQYFATQTSPTGDDFVLRDGTPITVTTSLAEYYIHILPKSHANMSAPNGESYAVEVVITGLACDKDFSGGDSFDQIVTIDNLSPDPATSTNGSVTSDTSITIGWTTSIATDYNRSVVLRWEAATPGAEVPVEGDTYVLDATIGGATVACIENTGTSSTVYSGVDGSGSDECSTLALTASTQYSYKHFERDDNGNWDTGTTNANSPLTTTGGADTTSFSDAGTNNSTVTIAPGASATDTGRFDIQDSGGGGSTVTSITITFPASVVVGIAKVAVWNAAESVEYLSATSPTSDTFVLTTGTAIPTTTSAVEFHILVTPKTHGDMAAPDGALYAATAYVSVATCAISGGCNTFGDTADSTVTIDNLSANAATATSGSVTSGTETLIGWTTSSSSDYNRSVVLRWQAATPGAEVPAEGSTYNLDDTIGGATVACVENTGTVSFSYSGTDGSGSDECSTTALTPGTQYSYKHFERDTNGNWDTGTTNLNSPLTTSAADSTSFYDSLTNNLMLTIAPGASATDTGRFDIQDSGGGGSTVTSITITFPASVVAGIAKVAVWNAAENTEYLSATSPSGDTFVLTTGTAIPTTASLIEFHILVTPKTHGDMAAPDGALYAATAYVSVATCAISGGCNTFGDSADNTVTIDNLSANAATATSASVTSDTSITVNWTTSSSSDYNRSIVLRWQASSPGAEVPVEGDTYALDATIGAATIACIENTGTASTAYGGVDGSGSDECSTTALTASTQYSYKHFERDDNGNWDTGTINANSPLTTTGAPTLTFTISDVVIGFGTLDSGNARYATSDATGASAEEEAHYITASTNGTNGYSLTVNGTTLTSTGGTIDPIGASNTVSSTGTEQFGLRMTATGGNGSVTAPYAASGFALDTDAFPSEVASDADGDDVTTTYSIRYLANIHADTEAGTYSSTLTYILVANF